ncbi:MAG TPA: septum formation initiator family protein [Candidatus Butyricicoccus stercorigallinarum]|nr:septum formation initiator family protein [Candidatus Butyricicoccus stercorigallinarum]
MKHRRKVKLHPLVKALLVLVVVFAGVRLISLQLQINELQQQCEELDKEIARKEQANEDLKESLDEGVTDEAMAKIARDVLGYASPGERIFIDSSQQ